ncbi:nitric oxide reductase activation protein NorD, partial [Pseudomonas aeruginosa]
PQAELNRELYRWLALLAASAGPLRHWAQDNQRWARQLLDAYPALRPRYARLVAAHLRQRPSLDDCPQAELNRELYRWLALLAASAGPLRHWAQDNQRW